MAVTTMITRGTNILLSPTHRTTKRSNSTTPKASPSPPDKIEIRVCTNRACRKQGALDILQVLSGIAPPQVAVTSCGCLGRCGSGPNVVILPEGVFVGHVGTPRKAADTMSYVCGVGGDVEGDKCLEALSLRKQAEEEARGGGFGRACRLLSEV